MFSLKDQSDNVIVESASVPVWSADYRAWLVDDTQYPDPDKEFIVDPPVASIPPTVSAIAFMRLFTGDERVKARELRATDPKIEDFWTQLEDLRVTEVVMALPSIQAEIEYTLTAINAAGVTIDVQERKAAILSGQPF